MQKSFRAKPSPSPFYTVADAYLMLDDLLGIWGQPVEQRREVWEQILELDETIRRFVSRRLR